MVDETIREYFEYKKKEVYNMLKECLDNVPYYKENWNFINRYFINLNKYFYFVYFKQTAGFLCNCTIILEIMSIWNIPGNLYPF